VLAPFVEYRDDTQDRSTQYGVNTSLVRQVSQFQSASLSYQVANREIHEYRFGDLASGEIDLLTFLTQVAQGSLDSLGSSVKSSTFTLSGITGTLDNAANPRLGIIVRPALQVTAPIRWSSTSFWRADVSANAFLPVRGRITLAARGAVGRLFPFGKSVPLPGEDPTNKILQLRDVMFTAGGTGDVRGWENRLLGPKVPDVRFTTDADNTLTPHTDSYVPLGGLERMSFSVELQLPLPGMGPNFGGTCSSTAARVRTEDHRFDLQQGEHGQEQMFYATGGGVDVRTPVGPIKLGVGYKLNPSLTDSGDPAVLLRAAADGKPVDRSAARRVATLAVLPRDRGELLTSSRARWTRPRSTAIVPSRATLTPRRALRSIVAWAPWCQHALLLMARPSRAQDAPIPGAHSAPTASPRCAMSATCWRGLPAPRCRRRWCARRGRASRSRCCPRGLQPQLRRVRGRERVRRGLARRARNDAALVGSLGASYSTTEQISIQFRSDFYLPDNGWVLKGDWRYLDTSQETFGLGPAEPGRSAYPMDFVLYGCTRSSTAACSDSFVYFGLGVHYDRYANIVDHRAENGEPTPFSVYSRARPSTRSRSASPPTFSWTPATTRSTRARACSGTAASARTGSARQRRRSTDAVERLPRFHPAAGSSRQRARDLEHAVVHVRKRPISTCPRSDGTRTVAAGAGTCRGTSAARTRSTTSSSTGCGCRGTTCGRAWASSTSWRRRRRRRAFGSLDPGYGVGMRMKFNKKTSTNLSVGRRPWPGQPDALVLRPAGGLLMPTARASRLVLGPLTEFAALPSLAVDCPPGAGAFTVDGSPGNDGSCHVRTRRVPIRRPREDP
jgi:hypothetical protein